MRERVLGVVTLLHLVIYNVVLLLLYLLDPPHLLYSPPFAVNVYIHLYSFRLFLIV